MLNRLKKYQFSALTKIFEGLPRDIYLFGSMVNLARKGGDIDILWVCPNDSLRTWQKKMDLTVKYQKMYDERIDIQIFPVEEKMTYEEKTFYHVIEKQKLF